MRRARIAILVGATLGVVGASQGSDIEQARRAWWNAHVRPVLQNGRAYSAVQNAQNSIESAVLDQGDYSKLTPRFLSRWEPGFRWVAGNRGKVGQIAVETEPKKYRIAATSATGHVYSITRAANGSIVRRCQPGCTFDPGSPPPAPASLRQ